LTVKKKFGHILVKLKMIILYLDIHFIMRRRINIYATLRCPEISPDPRLEGMLIWKDY